MVDLFFNVLGMLDPILIFWAIVLNIVGFYLKRIGTPKACPPIPLLLYIVAFVPCFILGWTKVDGFSGKAAIEAIMYGVSNAGFITLPAIFGYDVVHCFTGGKAPKREYKLCYKSTLLDAPKLKAIVYGIATSVAFAVSSLVAFFAFHESVIYSLCWGAFFGGLAFTSARLVLYEIKKVDNPETIAIDVYLYIACFAWLGLILTGSWLWVSLFAAVMVAAMLMAVGTRFTDPVEEEETKYSTDYLKKAKHLDGESELDFLARNLRFRLTNDRLDGDADLSRPVCEVDDEPLTCDEADARGFGVIAAEGLEYCKQLIRNKNREE